MVCPVAALRFAEYLDDVGGLSAPPKGLLSSFDTAELPPYIPQINHGGSRTSPLDEPWVTVPIYSVAGYNRLGRYQVRYDSASALRAGLRLSAQTKIIVTSVAPDRHIEDFWEHHVSNGILAQLAEIGIEAMTVPNYSFMLDVPRTNSLYNLSRMFRVAERMTESGIPTILHLNASTNRDWELWREVLTDQPHMSCISMEFQTGLHIREVGDHYFSNLVGLQDSLGHALHPFALAGTGRIEQFRSHFEAFTVVDATPFLKTMHRQILLKIGRKWKWRKQITQLGAPLNGYLSRNIRLHRERQLARINFSGGFEREGFLNLDYTDNLSYNTIS